MIQVSTDTEEFPNIGVTSARVRKSGRHSFSPGILTIPDTLHCRNVVSRRFAVLLNPVIVKLYLRLKIALIGTDKRDASQNPWNRA